MTPVPFWKNPTLLTNAILLAVLAALTVLADHPTWDRAAWIAVGLAVVNVLLQFVGTPPLPGSPAARKQDAQIARAETRAVEALSQQYATVQRVRDGVQINGPTTARNIAGHDIHDTL